MTKRPDVFYVRSFCLCRLGEHILDRALGLHADGHFRHNAIFKNGQRRDAGNAKLGGERRGFININLSDDDLALFATVGASIRQGPHQVAQKSTRTGLSDFSTTSSKLFSVTTISAIICLLSISQVNN